LPTINLFTYDQLSHKYTLLCKHSVSLIILLYLLVFSILKRELGDNELMVELSSNYEEKSWLPE